MEQENEKETAQTSDKASKKDVTFPGSKRKKKGKKGRRGLLIVVTLLVLAGLAAGGWYIFSEPEVEDDFINETSPTPTLSESTPTPTEEPVERTEVSIQVLNGTGLPGEAASSQEELEELGYESIDIGNADTQDYEVTSITFDEGVPREVRDEIAGALEEIFEDVSSDEDSLTDYDVVIITGYPAGHSPTPTAAPTTTSTPTPTATDSATTGE